MSSNAKTKLQLVKDLVDEAQGISGIPKTTINQTGQFKRAVRWIDTAYRDIQRARSTWLFLRFDFTGSLTSAAGSVYTADALGVDHHSRWICNENGREDDMRIYSDAVGVTDEQPIFYMPWDRFRGTYMIGSAREATGRPQVFSVTPANAIIVHPIHDEDYTLVGEYYRTPHVFGEEDDVEDDDAVPIFPEEFHDIVMWGALLAHATRNGEYDIAAEAEYNYKLIKSQMERDFLPVPVMGAPLV